MNREGRTPRTCRTRLEIQTRLASGCIFSVNVIRHRATNRRRLCCCKRTLILKRQIAPFSCPSGDNMAANSPPFFYIACVALIVGINPYITHAMSSFGQKGLEAAAEAGKQAADAAIVASRNVTMTTNQFGLVISDYYGSDPNKKADAKRLIEGAFNVKLEDIQGKFNAEVTVTFSNLKPGDSLQADLEFLDIESDVGIQSVMRTSSAFHAVTINKSLPSVAAQDQLRSQIASLIENRSNGAGCPAPINVAEGAYPGPFVVVTTNQKEIDNCKIAVENKALTEAIVLGNSFQPNLPIANSFSRSYLGGKYAVLVIPQDDLDKIKDYVKIEIIMHHAGDTTKRLTVFKDPTRVINSFMSKRVAPTENDAYKAFNYFFVDLKLEGFYFTAPLISEK